MPIYFGDTIQNQNGDYPVLDLLNNHAAGVAFVDDWSNSALEAISLPRRRTGMIVAVKAGDDSGELYMWTGGETDAVPNVAEGAGNFDGAFNNIDNPLWKQIGGGVDSLRTIDIPVQLGTDAQGHPQTFGRFSDGDTIEMLPAGSNAFDIIIDAVTGFVDPVVTGQAVTEQTDGDGNGLGTYTTTGVVTTIPYDDQQRANIETDMRFNIKNSSQGAINGDTLRFKIWKIVIESSTSSNFSSGVTTELTLLENAAVPDPIFADINGVLGSGVAPTSHQLHYEDTFTVGGNAEGAQVYYRCKLFQANGQGQIKLTNGTFVDDIDDAGNAAVTVTSAPVTRLSVQTYVAPQVVDIQARRSASFSDIAPDFAITSLLANGIAAWNYTWIGGGALDALSTYHTGNDGDNTAQSALSRQTLVGNSGFDFQCTIKRKTAAVDILRVQVQRSVDGGDYTTVQDTDFTAQQNTTAEDAGYDLDTAGTLASNFSLRLVDTNATTPTDSISYRVRITDESHGADQYEDIEVLNIDMWNPVYVGQSLIDNDPASDAPAGVQLATLAANQTALTDNSVEALVGAGNKLRFAAARPGFGSNIARASNSQGMANISTTDSEFVYIVYPDSDPMIQWIGEQEGVGQNNIQSFCTSADAANPAQATGPSDLESFTNNSLSYENAAGYSQTYRVLRTNAKDAFNIPVSLNIF